jgi:hypothetical protein
MMALFPIILFVTTNIYEKVKTRRLKCSKHASAVERLCKDNKHFFCSTLSEFENFLLCERILINVITCQNETSS